MPKKHSAKGSVDPVGKDVRLRMRTVCSRCFETVLEGTVVFLWSKMPEDFVLVRPQPK